MSRERSPPVDGGQDRPSHRPVRRLVFPFGRFQPKAKRKVSRADHHTGETGYSANLVRVLGSGDGLDLDEAEGFPVDERWIGAKRQARAGGAVTRVPRGW